MSEGPGGWKGQFVENVMRTWYANLEARGEPRPNTATYNAAYEAVVLHVGALESIASQHSAVEALKAHMGFRL